MTIYIIIILNRVCGRFLWEVRNDIEGKVNWYLGNCYCTIFLNKRCQKRLTLTSLMIVHWVHILRKSLSSFFAGIIPNCQENDPNCPLVSISKSFDFINKSLIISTYLSDLWLRRKFSRTNTNHINTFCTILLLEPMSISCLFKIKLQNIALFRI